MSISRLTDAVLHLASGLNENFNSPEVHLNQITYTKYNIADRTWGFLQKHDWK